MVDINLLKDKIMMIIRNEGPVLPIQISRKLERDTFFAGAVLGELVRGGLIKISIAKIGGSPVYYLNGQESKLTLLYDYLPGKEKEAYELLRKNQILKDVDCEPAIRVALRTIRDFAFSLDVHGVFFWRWYLITEEEAKTLISELSPVQEVKNVIVEERKIPVREKPSIEAVLKPDTGNGFLDLVVNYFRNNKIHVVENGVLRKQREMHGKIKVNSDLGVLDYFFIAKNKKSINDADLSLASDLGRRNKLPVLFLGNGRLSKKADTYLEENLKGKVLFRKL